MKTHVVCYSRTGMTLRVCTEIAGRLSVDCESLVEDTDRSGAVGYLTSALDALRRRSSEIDAVKLPFADCDRLIIGTPVWCGTLPPAVRTFLTDYRAHFRAVSFVATMGFWGARRVFREMAALCGREPDGTAFFLRRDIRRGLYAETVAMLIDRVQNTRKND